MTDTFHGEPQSRLARENPIPFHIFTLRAWPFKSNMVITSDRRVDRQLAYLIEVGDRFGGSLQSFDKKQEKITHILDGDIPTG